MRSLWVDGASQLSSRGAGKGACLLTEVGGDNKQDIATFCQTPPSLVPNGPNGESDPV